MKALPISYLAQISSILGWTSKISNNFKGNVTRWGKGLGLVIADLDGESILDNDLGVGIFEVSIDGLPVSGVHLKGSKGSFDL